ncbi:hypothetical protein CC86DRAFT_396597 [Ophiobolus disseminans]|uniref:Uncharacterized protein n=1 Tax=Ophiobolus disseminans TaxID=1469910 RepID=A0A6A6ZS92_9PLEO|nr:hypothetical protein CC86DRAFT_396597 [Ophiobolus disseminans]
MEAVAAAKPITATLYRDWLHWSKHAALTWLVRLDKVERRFRIASLSYHQTPYALRHSATLLHGSRIDQVVLNRLSDILESDRSRTQQTFFSPWYEIKNVAADILKDLDYYEPIPDDLDFLRTVHRKFELSLIKLPEALHTLVEGLKWLEATIWEVAERSDLDGSEALASKHSREGGLFRRWMLSLPELDPEFVESKSEYIEWYVDRLLEVGVEKDQYWSNLSYRKAGIFYHTSQAAARTPANFPQERLTLLARVFEISNASEYAALFNKLHNVIEKFTDLRSTHARPYGTAEELNHRLGRGTLDISSEFDEWSEGACGLFDVSRALYETDDNGTRCAWYGLSGPDPIDHPILYRKGEEWEKFWAWVWSLPETQRSVQVGRTVDEVAFGMLFDEPEGLEPEGLL